MIKRKNIANIPRALFEDENININRGEYIVNYMTNEGKEVPHDLIQKHGYYVIPQSIINTTKRGELFLADLTFLFACYYVASTNKKRNIQLHEVFDFVTSEWDEFRINNTAETFNFINMEKYKRWIKKYDYDNKYHVKY